MNKQTEHELELTKLKQKVALQEKQLDRLFDMITTIILKHPYTEAMFMEEIRGHELEDANKNYGNNKTTTADS